MKKLEVNKYNYKNWQVFFIDSLKLNYKLIGKKLIDKEYKIIKVLKDTQRNYVAIIEVDKKKYILKEFRSEIMIPQRKIQTIFKQGEALTTLKNGIEAINEGIIELVNPLIAIVKKKLMIEKSYLLMEYIEGESLRTINDIDEVIDIIKKVHLLGRYHGDLNTSNFIKAKGKIRILDTQMKKEKYLFFKRAYDILTLKEDLLVKYLNYDVDKKYGKIKGFSAKIALFLKKVKRLKYVEQFRKLKSKLREKGIKI